MEFYGHNIVHRRRNLLKVEGGTDIIARGARRIFDHAHIPFNHAHFYIKKKAVGQADKDFLAVARAVSQPEHAL